MKTLLYAAIFLLFMVGVLFSLPTPDAIAEVKKTTDIENDLASLTDSAMLSDFNENSEATIVATFGTQFQVTTDQMMQGQSIASIEWLADSCDGGGLLVKGEIKTGFSFPWAGVYLPFSPNSDQTLELTSARDYTQSIEFMVKGNTGTYQLMVFVLNSMQPMMIPFSVTEQCQLVSIDFSDHPNIDWSQTTGLAWVADGSRIEAELAIFSFELDNVRFK